MEEVWKKESDRLDLAASGRHGVPPLPFILWVAAFPFCSIQPKQPSNEQEFQILFFSVHSERFPGGGSAGILPEGNKFAEKERLGTLREALHAGVLEAV